LIERSNLPAILRWSVAAASVDPAQTTASGSGLSNSVAGAAGPVVIQTRDRHGNVLAADQTLLSVVLRSTSGGGNSTATVTAVAGMVGQYQTSLSPTVAGAYSVEVRYGGTLVGGASTGTPKIVSPGNYKTGHDIWC
jgi:hypothetical protein